MFRLSTLTAMLTLLFTQPLPTQSGFSISLDLDTSKGDQSVRSSSEIEAGSAVPLQIFGTDIKNATGFGARFEYDETQIAYDGFDVGDALPGAQSPGAEQGTNPTYVEVTAASLGDVATSNSGLLGTVRFRTSLAFSRTTIQMVSAEILRSGAFEELTSTVDLQLERAPCPDFDGDGKVGFHDFLLLAGSYGSRQGESSYDPEMDLDRDGSIGFRDFLRFAENYGKECTAPPPRYAISGLVTVDVAGLADVTVTLTGGRTVTATTREDGSYSFTGLVDGDYTVTPSKEGYTFTPDSLQVSVSGADVTGQDFVAGAVVRTYSISGTVIESEMGLSGVTVALSGDDTDSTTTGPDGEYGFTELPDGSYTVTPAKADYTFTPASVPVAVAGADVAGRDFTAIAHSPGDTLTVNLPVGSVDMAFVYIPSGTFTMGSPSSEVGRFDDEGPLHQVTISQGFHLGKYEVTQAQWEAVMGTTPWSGKSFVQARADNPAVYISWNDAQAYVEKLNAGPGYDLYRLPTEAEWEYACRAGTTTRWSFGDGEWELGDHAYYLDNAWDVGERYVHRVGTKLPNPWGVFDMHGNAYEWCVDWYGSYSSSAQIDPLGPLSGSDRVERGGSFDARVRQTRSASRNNYPPWYSYSGSGFRLLRRVQ
jgi:formylglycine-generating enzyme required for sulfatase activity